MRLNLLSDIIMQKVKDPISNKLSVFLGIFGILVLIIGYQYLSYNQHFKNPTDTTLPNLQQLWNGLVISTTPKINSIAEAFGEKSDELGALDFVTKTPLYKDVLSTYSRLVKGLFLGCVLATILGVAMGCYEFIASLFLPPLSLLAKIPGTAMLAVFFVMVGTGEVMFGVMIGFGILPTLTQAIYLSAKHDVHEEEIDKAYTLGASNMEVIYNVVFKQTLPKIIENVRLQIGPAMVCLIAAEMLVGQVGMGYQIRMQQRLLNMNIVYDYLIILGITGLIMDRVMLFFRCKLCPWYDR